MSKYLDSAGLSRVWSKIKAMFAPLASPSLTGTPTAPTAAEGTNTTQIATTAFVKTAVTNAAITVDSALSSTSTNPVQNKVINTALGTKAPLASPTFTGTPKAPTAATSTNNTQIATTAFVKAAITAAAPTIDTAMSDTSTNAVQNKVIKSYVDKKVSTTYKPAGSLMPSEIVAGLLVAANEGNVYNIKDEFTTTNDFVEGAGVTYPAGTNIVVINTNTVQSPTYKFDVLAGFVDLSPYATNAALAKQIEIHMPGVVYLSTDNQGGDPEIDYHGTPAAGEFFFANDTSHGGDGKMYMYTGSTWSEYTGNKVFIVQGAQGTEVGDDGSYVLTTAIMAYDQGDAVWVNLLSIFAANVDLHDYKEQLEDAISDVEASVNDLNSWKLERTELFFYLIDSAHQTTSAPATGASKKGEFYWNYNTRTMYRFSGTQWVLYTGNGYFIIDGDNTSIDASDNWAFPDVIYYDGSTNGWCNVWSVLKTHGSALNNVVRPIGRTGTPAATGHSVGQYYLYKTTIEGNTVLTLYVGNANGSVTAITASDKLFLYDGMVYQFISGSGEGTGLQPVGHVESITDSEIDTICV